MQTNDGGETLLNQIKKPDPVASNPTNTITNNIHIYRM